MVMLVLFYVKRVEKRPLASIGFHPLGVKNIAIAVISGIVMVAGSGCDLLQRASRAAHE